MKKTLLISIMTLLTVLCGSTYLQATVINFDDIPNQGYFHIPSNYQGFVWDSSFYVQSQNVFQKLYNNNYGFPSTLNAAFNIEGGHPIALSSAEDFNFKGAYFTSWAKGNQYALYSATAITVEGYNDGIFVGTVSMILPANGFAWLNANLNGVNELRFGSSDNRGWWLMNNFTYDSTPATPASPVPEPATLLLLGSGIVGLVGFRKKIKK